MNKKTAKVLRAIEELFADMSVSQQATLDELREIKSELEIKIEAIESDIVREVK